MTPFCSIPSKNLAPQVAAVCGARTFANQAFRWTIAPLLVVGFCGMALLGVAGEAKADGTISLLGQLELPGSFRITDVWGYVDTLNNKEYAVVGDQTFSGGFYIVDVTDPGNPTLTKQVTGPTLSGFDVKVWDHYVFAVNGTGNGSGFIYDISDPANPDSIGSFGSSHNVFIDERGYLYQAKTSPFNGLAISDLNPDITNPTFLFGDQVVDDHDILVLDTLLYDFHGSQYTRIYGVTDPANPNMLGQITGGVSFHHSGYPTEDGNYLFITNELAANVTPDITVWNIEDPSMPSMVGEYTDSSATVHNIVIIGSYAYVSYYTSGFVVLDISDPTTPVLCAQFDTAPGTEGDGTSIGAFGVYPFAPSGNIYISDEPGGLYVFSFTPDPVAVAITMFRAEVVSGGVRLQWEIGHARGLKGFNIYRSESSRDDDYIKITRSLIPAGAEFEYIDRSAEPGQTYHYRLGAIDDDGEFFSAPSSVTIPRRAALLSQNYPNPFKPTTTIEYELSETSPVVLTVYNALGQPVRRLVHGAKGAGRHTVEWDGKNAAGRTVSSGVYFYRLDIDGVTRTRRMIHLK